MRTVFFWIGCMLSVVSSAQAVTSIDTGDKMHNLAKQSAYFEDPEGKLTIDEILQPGTNARFQPLNTQFVNFGVTSSAFWVRVNLYNNTSEKVLIEVGNNALSDIRVFEITQNRIRQQFHTGHWKPFNQREIKNVNYLFPLSIGQGEQSTVYLRVTHTRGTQFRLKAGTLVAYYETGTRRSLLEGMYYGFMLVMMLYNLFLFFSLRDRAYLFYVIYIFFMALLNATINGFAYRFLWSSFPVINRYDDIIAALAGIAGILFASKFLNIRKNVPFFYRVFLSLLAVYLIDIGLILSGQFQLGIVILELNSLLLVFSFFIAAFRTLRNGYKPARFFLIAWSFLLLSVVFFILSNFNILPSTSFASHSIQIGSAVEALLLSMALANRINVYKEEKRKAQQAALRSLEKNKKLVVEQNMMLEKKVAERTNELEKANDELMTALQNLKETQAQLVQREKMASLGELTAGIAHEIQNPLNFVNNFSEVSSELVDELRSELTSGTREAATGIADDLKINLQKILSHGRRADSIVRGMLEHTRLHTVKREEIALNDLVEESMRQSYRAVRSADQAFAAIIETHFDENIGKVEVVTQDIGRVLLNIFNNAFYSLREKKKVAPAHYQPVLSIVTRRDKSKVTISIRDNGTGISPKVQAKIYQPFFTTKPAGDGAGMGLSVSYDIITKEHEGSLRVDTVEGEYAEFVIQLPLQPQTV